MKKTPRRTDSEAAGPPLSRLESFVLSRVDGSLSLTDLVDLTGLAAPQVEQILTKLTARGAIEVAEDASVPQLDELLADEPIATLEEVVDLVPLEPEPMGETSEPPVAMEDMGDMGEPMDPAPDSWIAEDLPEAPEVAGGLLFPREAAEMQEAVNLPELEEVFDPDLLLPPEDDWAVPVSRPTASARRAAEDAAPDSLENLPEDSVDAAPPPEEQHAMLVPAEGDITDPTQANTDDVRNYRKLFETKYRNRTSDERVKAAKMLDGPDLFALCFDPDPHVIQAILDNDRASLDHARLIAAHHRNPVGLAALCERVSILKDDRVQRMLLRNNQLTDALIRKILMPKRLLEIYKAAMDRDVTDRVRTTSKGLFKGKFSRATAEEKFEIIWNTEGRVLPHLLGQVIDMKTTALFCARNFTSVVLIQAFSRFPATPPGILAHILRQPLVKRQVHLRNMILQHPNVPSEAKRLR